MERVRSMLYSPCPTGNHGSETPSSLESGYSNPLDVSSCACSPGSIQSYIFSIKWPNKKGERRLTHFVVSICREMLFGNVNSPLHSGHCNTLHKVFLCEAIRYKDRQNCKNAASHQYIVLNHMGSHKRSKSCRQSPHFRSSC